MALFNKVSVGLEIDSNEARVVEISSGVPKPRLLKWGRIPMPEGIVKDGVIINSDKASVVLKELWDKTGIKSRNVILGVLNQDVIVRFAAFPKVEPDKLKGLIQFQAQEFFPLPVETLIMDFMVIEEFMKNDSPMVEVLLVAAKKSMIKGFVSTCDKAELRLNDIDVSTLSLIRTSSEEDNKSSIAIANFYSEMAGILLLRKGVPRLSRIIPVSFKNKNEQKCKPENEMTENADRGMCYDNEDIQKWGDALTEEINSSIDFYQSQKGAAIIEKIYICGSAMKYKGLMENMTGRFDINFKLIDTSEKLNFRLKSYEETKDFVESDFAVCISLALRGLEEK